MGIKNKISPGNVYFITITIVDWLDIFTRPAHKHIIVRSIKKTPESRRDWLLNLFWYAGKNDKKIKYYKVWQESYDAKEIDSSDFLDQKMEYIHNNPIRAEIVANPIDYLYSSARDYAGEKGRVNIELV
jgi:putative transposase